MGYDFRGHFKPGRVRRWKYSGPDKLWGVGKKDSGNNVELTNQREFESSLPWGERWDWVFNLLDRFLGIFPQRDDPGYLFAAFVHDVMLEELDEKGEPRFGRAQAAAEWYDAALFAGAPKRKTAFAYVGVACWAVFKEEEEERGQ